MSLAINTTQLSHRYLTQIKADLEIMIPVQTMSKTPMMKPLICYTLTENDMVYLPFSYAIHSVEMLRPPRDVFPQSDLVFSAELREEQIEVKDEALDALNKTGHIMIASYTGFGKSILGAYLGAKTRLKTLLLVPNKTVLIPQWVDTFNKFCKNSRVQVLTSKDEHLDKDCNVYIMNALNAGKKKPDFFKDIGTVIVDESHLIAAEMLIKSMHNVCPRYLIGLSATPYRNDGLDVLIKLHFGSNVIERKMNRQHVAYLVQTKFKPTADVDVRGKIIWSSVINAQSDNRRRNELIANIAHFFSSRVFLILVKRVEQAKEIGELLRQKSEHVAVILGKDKSFDREARILIGTQQKCGIGFDHPNLDAMILGNDCEDYFIQSLGRIFRKKDTIPIVFDLVDNHPILIRHWKTRKQVYLEHGGSVKDFNITFPQLTMDLS